MPEIFTLDGRDNVYLEVVMQHLGLSNPEMRETIETSHEALVSQLHSKGVKYGDLRNALVPHTRRCEAAFVFDSSLASSSNYGLEIACAILPLLDREQRCSLLSGDLIHAHEQTARHLVESNINAYREFEFRHTSALYCIYLNNLSEAQLATLDLGLRDSELYLGYFRVPASSALKDWLSTTLSAAYVKCGSRFIGGQEEDRPPSDNANLRGWPVEEFGYSLVAVQMTNFDLFLSYKIERAVYPGFESDNLMALAAISADPADLTKCEVLVEPAKVAYLRSAKSGSLGVANIQELDSDLLSQLIKSKIASNYLYNLRFLKSHGVSLFNIVLEVVSARRPQPVRLLASLEYQPSQRRLRLVTLY